MSEPVPERVCQHFHAGNYDPEKVKVGVPIVVLPEGQLWCFDCKSYFYPLANPSPVADAIDRAEAVRVVREQPCTCDEPTMNMHRTANPRCQVLIGKDLAARLAALPASVPTTESPILAFEAWLIRWVADNGRKLTQTEYGIAYDAFIAAHPGEGPQASVMAVPTAVPTAQAVEVVQEIRNEWLQRAITQQAGWSQHVRAADEILKRLQSLPPATSGEHLREMRAEMKNAIELIELGQNITACDRLKRALESSVPAASEEE